MMRIDGWLAFGGKHKAIITQCAADMADTVTGAHKRQISNLFAAPLFGDREDLAYLQGSKVIESLQLGHFGIRQLARQFERALVIRGLSGLDVNMQVAQFQVYYWTMMISLTNGADRRRVRRKVDRLRQFVGH